MRPACRQAVFRFRENSMGNIHPITITIIIVNVLFSMKGFNDYGFFEKYKFNVGGIRRGEQVRMFSSAFLHANTPHLLFNMLTLYFFANSVIRYVGEIRYIIIYAASLLIGNLLSYYLNNKNYHYSAVGASGAVMGILYSAILLDPNLPIYGLPGWIFGVGYLIYTLYGMIKKNDNIGHDAHFGGAIAGLVLALIYVPDMLQIRPYFILALLTPIVLFFILLKLNKI